MGRRGRTGRRDGTRERYMNGEGEIDKGTGERVREREEREGEERKGEEGCAC